MTVAKEDPKRLALWAVGGALLAAATAFTALLPLAQAHRVPFFSGILVQLTMGFTVSMLSARRLKSSHRLGAWTDEALAPTRALLASPVWAWLGISMLVAGLLIVCLNRHSGVFIYIATLPLTVVSDLHRALAPATQRERQFVDWKSFKPLHSDHWGEATGTHNDALPS